MDKARETALRIIAEISENDAYANVALARAFKNNELSQLDRRFVTELVYGTTKATGTLDWMIRRYVNRPLKKISPVVLSILRMGFYQLIYMDKVPESAACNESVELAKGCGGIGASKFVNAVMRTAIREPEKRAFPEGKGHASENLALREWHPQWLVKRWIKAFGYQEAEELCRFNNQEAGLILRANTLKTDRDSLMNMLKDSGAEAEISDWAPEAVKCVSHGALDSLKPLQEGFCQVQDESSMQVAHVVDPQPGEFIIDTCAAPGGKTTHMAALMKNQGRILAGDVYDHKLKRVRDNAERLGISIIETLEIDAREIGAKFKGQADRVLVDAPCSGLGVLRRKPDARWKKSPELLKELPELQREILQSASEAVKSGGVLVYSTCTIDREENSAVVESFLKENPDFSLEVTGKYLPSHKSEDSMVQLYPQRDGTDGFFIARMKRKG